MGMKLPKALEAEVLARAGVGKKSRRPRAAKKLSAGWAVELTLPCVVLSEANQRCHWTARRKRFDGQRAALRAVLIESPAHIVLAYGQGLAVTWTHVGRRMDSDNLAGAFKALRDDLASFFGIDDGSDLWEWHYRQEAGTPGVRVRIEGKP